MKFNFNPSIKAAHPDGSMTPEMRSTLSQLFTSLQQILSNEGFSIPELSTHQFSQLDPSKSDTKLVINNGQLLINLGGTFKTIQVV